MLPATGILAVTVLASAAAAQTAAPAICPWCRNDPALMEASGIVSHGPLGIGPRGSQAIADASPKSSWIFVETAHVRWASSLGPSVVEAEDKLRVQAEVDRLREKLPALPKEPKKLDPWLRLHLFAVKGEDLYARFQELLAVRDADFPAERSAEGPFMGNGRYLGEKDKFEVVIHASRATHRAFTLSLCGVEVTDSLRWHFNDMHKLLVSLPAEDSDLKRDRWLWPHVVHNLSHTLLSAYKHFSYDPPFWLDEGLAHALEKEAEPASTTHCGEEGMKRDGRGPKSWAAAARKLVAAGEAPTFADLVRRQSIGEFDIDANVVCWSRVRFLIERHPAELARFLGGVKGQLDAERRPSGADLPGLQRKLLKECFDWQPAAFDEAWKSWVTQ